MRALRLLIRSKQLENEMQVLKNRRVEVPILIRDDTSADEHTTAAAVCPKKHTYIRNMQRQSISAVDIQAALMPSARSAPHTLHS